MWTTGSEIAQNTELFENLNSDILYCSADQVRQSALSVVLSRDSRSKYLPFTSSAAYGS